MMKKLFVVFVLALLFSGAVLAQELEGNVNDLDGASFDLRERSNEVLESEIQIPGGLQFLARVVFGLGGESDVSLQLFFVLVGLWIIVLLFVKSFGGLILGIGEGLKAWTFSIAVVSILFGLSGGLLFAAQFFLDLSKLFGLLEDWSIITLLIAVSLLFVIYYLATKLIKILKVKSEVAEAEEIGRDIGFARLFGKASREFSE